METDKKIIKSIAKLAWSGLTAIKEHELSKLKLKSNALRPISCQEALSLKTGDVVCVENHVGVVVLVERSSLLMINPFQGSANWGSEWHDHLPYLDESGHSYDVRTSADSFIDGKNNTEIIEKSIGDGVHFFPAFKYCIEQGVGWFLPAIGELELFKDTTLLKRVNATLIKYHVDIIIPDKGSNIFWSSTDNKNDQDYYTSAYALSVAANGEVTTKIEQKGERKKILPFYRYTF